MSKTRKSIRILLWTTALLVLFPASCSVVFKSLELSMKQEVGAEIPPDFPILVITPVATPVEGERRYDAQIVYQANIDDFLESHPESSYLVPAGEDEALNQQLRRRKGAPAPWRARESFQVERRSDGSQSLRVETSVNDPGVIRGWYEATENGIVSTHYLAYFGPVVFGGAFAITVVSWAIAAMLYGSTRMIRWWLRKRRSAAQSVS